LVRFSLGMLVVFNSYPTFFLYSSCHSLTIRLVVHRHLDYLDLLLLRVQLLRVQVYMGARLWIPACLDNWLEEIPT
jgi:hypothetical protein